MFREYKYAEGWIVCFDHSIHNLYCDGETIDYYIVRQVKGMIKSDITVYKSKAAAVAAAENISNHPIVEVA